MAAANIAYAAYRTAEVHTISKRDLIVKLYQGAERFLVQAQTAMQNRQIEMAHNACIKTKNIFSELLVTLNMENGGEIAVSLQALYVFFINEITEANMRKDPKKIAGVLPIIATLREGWQQVPAEYANLSSLEANEGHILNVRT